MLLIYGYKVLSISQLAKLGSDSYIFCFPENADKYTQVFVMDFGVGSMVSVCEYSV